MEEAISAPASAEVAPIAAPEIIPAAPAVPAADTAPAADAKPVFEKTPRGAVERAMAKLNGERERDTGGRFVGKDGQPAAPATVAALKPADAPAAPTTPVGDLPEWMKADPAAATEWANAGPALKAAMLRRGRELEGGIEKYKTAATAFEDLKEFDELARSTGTTMKAAMTEYVGIERLLKQDVIAGFDKICGNMGLSLADVARHIVKAIDGQPAADGSPAPVATPQDQTIRALQKELNDLKASVGTVTKTYETDRNIAALSPHVEAFAAKAENSRFSELENDIIDILSGKGSIILPDRLQPLEKLSEAYRMASLLKPAPAVAPVIAAPQTRNPDPAAQTRKGSLSVSGAPGNGSDPSSRKPAPSIREAIRSAAAQVG